MRVDYLVSRFPRTSETFIVRELDRLSDDETMEIGLRSLFSSPDTTVHAIARPWLGRLVRPDAATAIRGVAWAAWRKPGTLGSIVALVVRDHLTKPGLLFRALLTCALACAHARDLRSTPTHLHAHFATYPALAAWVCHRLVGVTYSFTAHAHDLYVDQSMLIEKVERASFVVTISRYNLRVLRALGTSTPVELVHCGIDTAAYPFDPPTSDSEPASGRVVSAVCVASLQEYKGHAVLLRALVDVPGLRVDLIGDGVLRRPLEQLALELGVADRVHFMGARDEEEVRAALAGAELFVLPSVIAADGQMEGLPVALVEALATGTPAVSTRLSGIPEIVVEGRTGRLATPGDFESLADALRTTITDRHATLRHAQAGRQLVEREFEIDVEVGKLLSLFRAVAVGK